MVEKKVANQRRVPNTYNLLPPTLGYISVKARSRDPCVHGLATLDRTRKSVRVLPGLTTRRPVYDFKPHGSSTFGGKRPLPIRTSR